jgi:hypothetical protein
MCAEQKGWPINSSVWFRLLYFLVILFDLFLMRRKIIFYLSDLFQSQQIDRLVKRTYAAICKGNEQKLAQPGLQVAQRRLQKSLLEQRQRPRLSILCVIRPMARNTMYTKLAQRNIDSRLVSCPRDLKIE